MKRKRNHINLTLIEKHSVTFTFNYLIKENADETVSVIIFCALLSSCSATKHGANMNFVNSTQEELAWKVAVGKKEDNLKLESAANSDIRESQNGVKYSYKGPKNDFIDAYGKVPDRKRTEFANVSEEIKNEQIVLSVSDKADSLKKDQDGLSIINVPGFERIMVGREIWVRVPVKKLLSQSSPPKNKSDRPSFKASLEDFDTLKFQVDYDDTLGSTILVHFDLPNVQHITGKKILHIYDKAGKPLGFTVLDIGTSYIPKVEVSTDTLYSNRNFRWIRVKGKNLTSIVDTPKALNGDFIIDDYEVISDTTMKLRVKYIGKKDTNALQLDVEYYASIGFNKIELTKKKTNLELTAKNQTTGSKWLKPTFFLPGSRVFFDSKPDTGEIDPFHGGNLSLNIQLVGFDVFFQPKKEQMKFGINLGGGISASKDSSNNNSSIFVATISGFLQYKKLLRFEFGYTRAISSNTDLGDKGNKDAIFIGIVYPTNFSESIKGLFD